MTGPENAFAMTREVPKLNVFALPGEVSINFAGAMEVNLTPEEASELGTKLQAFAERAVELLEPEPEPEPDSEPEPEPEPDPELEGGES